jgi:hypothetical protein
VYVDVDDNYAEADGFDNYNEVKAEAHRELVREADGVICASANLADYYADLNENVHFIPNSVDLKEWEFRRTESRYLRVGWSAGTTHHHDAPLVEPAMRWASETEGCQAVVVGVDPGWDFEYMHYPWLPLEAYWRLLDTFTIGLAPLLQDSKLNFYRSDLKWLDYSMAGALTVASDKPAYNPHGEGGRGGRRHALRAPHQSAGALHVASACRRVPAGVHGRTRVQPARRRSGSRSGGGVGGGEHDPHG